MYYIYPIWGCSIQTDIQPSSSSSHILTWYHSRRFDLHRSPPSPSSAALPLGGANSTPRGSNLSTKPIFFLVVKSQQQQQVAACLPLPVWPPVLSSAAPPSAAVGPRFVIPGRRSSAAGPRSGISRCRSSVTPTRSALPRARRRRSTLLHRGSLVAVSGAWLGGCTTAEPLPFSGPPPRSHAATVLLRLPDPCARLSDPRPSSSPAHSASAASPLRLPQPSRLCNRGTSTGHRAFAGCRAVRASASCPPPAAAPAPLPRHQASRTAGRGPRLCVPVPPGHPHCAAEPPLHGATAGWMGPLLQEDGSVLLLHSALLCLALPCAALLCNCRVEMAD